MKVAVLAHLHHAIRQPYAGGTEMHTAVVADELVRRGHDVTLFAKAGSETRARLVPAVDEDFVFGRMPGADGDRSEAITADAISAAIDRIRTEGFDVVFNNSLSPVPYTYLSDHPMLTVLHTPPTLEKVLAVVGRPDWEPDPRHAYVSVSERNSAAWREVLPTVSCVRNGIFLNGWYDRGTSEPDLAVWSARITPEKGLHLAIDAVRQAGLRLEISGPIADRAYFDREIAGRLDDRARYVGHVHHDQLPGQLGRGAVFVSSSVWAEPFGLSLVEAMACGTPVAAFATGAAPELLTAESGVLAREETVACLAEAVAGARELDRRAVRRRAEDFDATIMVDQYVAILDQLCRGT